MLKLRSLQFIRIILSMSECLHRDGIRYGGRYDTLFKASRQSEMISTLPFKGNTDAYPTDVHKVLTLMNEYKPLKLDTQVVHAQGTAFVTGGQVGKKKGKG